MRSENTHAIRSGLNLTQSNLAIIMNKPNKPASAHPRSIHKTSEFLGILLCAAAYTLQRGYPLASPSNCIPVFKAVGYLLLVLSAAILNRTLVEMAKYGQPHEPGKPTSALITTGPFHYSRNPTYTTIILFLLPGLALVFESTWLLLLLPISFGLFWNVMVKPEEKYLQDTFGGGREWKEYCKHTRRWL